MAVMEPPYKGRAGPYMVQQVVFAGWNFRVDPQGNLMQTWGKWLCVAQPEWVNRP